MKFTFCRNKKQVSCPDVSIILLTWNRAGLVDQCLKALYSALSHDLTHEILILDNGSTDKTADAIKKYASYPETKIFLSPENNGLNAYKKLFGMARGRVIIELDDDVLEFPDSFDKTMTDYLNAFPDYCYLSLNVVQNEYTDGAKPSSECYTPVLRNGMIVDKGPAGGWCAAFRRNEYRKFRLFFNCLKLNHARPEDGALIGCFRYLLHNRNHGVIHDAVCLHACGPWYAKRYGETQREMEKYTAAGMNRQAEQYR